MPATDTIDTDHAAQSAAPASESDNQFERIETPTADGNTLVKDLPKQRVPALAKVGMVAMLTGSSDLGTIIHITPTHAVIQGEKECEALPWGEVSLECVEPDLSDNGAGEAATPGEPGTWYLPVHVGMRAQGWDGDSTDGGEIVAITPELCHIKGEAAGCVFACPWDQITFCAESLEQPIRLINGNGTGPVNTSAPTDTPEPDYATPYSSMPATVNAKDGETDVWPGMIICEPGEATGYLVMWTKEAAILRLPDGTVHQQSWCVLETTGGPSPLKIDRFRLLMCQLFSFEKEVYQLCKKYSVDPEKYDELGSGLHQAQRDLGLISDEITEQAHRDKWMLPETVCGCRMGGVDDETVEGGVT